MGYGKVGFGKDEMCSYKHTHNSAVHIVVRYYDPENPEQWVKSTVFKVSNVKDRVLGNNGILHLQLDLNEANQLIVNRLLKASIAGEQFIKNNTHFSKNIKQFLDENGKIKSSIGYFSSFSQSINNRENIAIGALEARLNLNLKEGLGRAVGSDIIIPSLFIGFEHNSFKFNPTLDIDENGRTNSMEIRLAGSILKRNPDMTATVTGNASIETQTLSNITLAKNRANTTLEKLFQEGISKGRLSAKESFSTNQSDKIKPKERNAIIKFNFPRK